MAKSKKPKKVKKPKKPSKKKGLQKGPGNPEPKPPGSGG